MKTLAIDFDGVLSRPHDGYKMGELMPGAKEAMTALHTKGYRLIVHTVRAKSLPGTKAVVDWMRFFEIPFHGVTATKPNCDVYLDDKALRFTDWKHAMWELGEGDNA